MTGRQPPTRKVITRVESAEEPLFHPDDWDMLQRFREELMGRRAFLHTFGGETGRSLSLKAGRGGSFLTYMETGSFRIVLSSIQAWCDVFGFTLGFELYQQGSVYMKDLSDPGVQMMAQLATTEKGQRLLLMTRLATIRALKGISAAEVGAKIGYTPEAVRRWEDDSKDPLLPRLFQQVRAIGLRLKFTVLRE